MQESLVGHFKAAIKGYLDDKSKSKASKKKKDKADFLKAIKKHDDTSIDNLGYLAKRFFINRNELCVCFIKLNSIEYALNESGEGETEEIMKQKTKVYERTKKLQSEVDRYLDLLTDGKESMKDVLMRPVTAIRCNPSIIEQHPAYKRTYLEFFLPEKLTKLLLEKSTKKSLSKKINEEVTQDRQNKADKIEHLKALTRTMGFVPRDGPGLL